jgi:hypothetical protein
LGGGVGGGGAVVLVLGVGVWGLGVWDLGSGVWGLGFRVSGPVILVWLRERERERGRERERERPAGPPLSALRFLARNKQPPPPKDHHLTLGTVLL